MPPSTVYAGSRMGCPLIFFKGRFKRPVEPGDIKNQRNALNWTTSASCVEALQTKKKHQQPKYNSKI